MMKVKKILTAVMVTAFLFGGQSETYGQKKSGKSKTTVLPSVKCEIEQTANGKIYRICEKDPSYLLDSAIYYVYIPDSVVLIRGAFVHQHGCGCQGVGTSTAHDVQYQSWAKKWGLAIIGPDLYAPKDCGDWKDEESGSAAALLKAMADVGKVAGHEELADAPWLLWGHSGGGYWLHSMLKSYPERILAAFSYSPAFDPQWEYPEQSHKVPVMIRHAGQGDAVAQVRETAVNAFAKLRKAGGYVAVAYTPYQGHNYSFVRYMAIPFYNAVLEQRLPVGDIGYKNMRGMDESRVWLGDTLSYGIYKADAYPGDPLSASWLPDSATAVKWREYVVTGTIVDRTPPPPPYDLKMTRKIYGGLELTWKADADIESGIKQFIIRKDGGDYMRYPPVGDFQHFDNNRDNAVPVIVPEMKVEFEFPWEGKFSIQTLNQFDQRSQAVEFE